MHTAPLTMLALISSGCADPEPPQNRQPAATQPAVSVQSVAERAVELREERLYTVTLRFKKFEYTLDFWKHVENAAAAEDRVVIVGEKTYNEYQIGKAISTKFDGVGFLLDGDVSQYSITPVKKEIHSQYFWVDKDGQSSEITSQQHEEAQTLLRGSGRDLLTVPYDGVTRTFVLDKPLAQYEFVEKRPLDRYFVTVKVQNSTLTLDFNKHLRNWANTHEITLEVPKEVYDKIGEVWDPQLNINSLLVKGRLSTLHGKVVKKRSEQDPKYLLAKTADGRQLVIPR